jgi:hypothetical protein
MASSFLILKPDVPDSALVITSSTPFEEDYPVSASFYGRGYTHARIQSAVGSFEITFDLGTGNSRAVDHLVLGGIKSLVATSTTGVVLSGSNNGTTWVSQLGTTSNFLTRTANGPYQDDVIFTPTYNDQIAGTISPYRYFKLAISKASGTAQFAFRKLYFGESFDMGKEPDNYNLEVANEGDADTWKYPRGHTILSKAYYPKHRVTVEWDGVDDAKANDFIDRVLNDPYRSTVYLYAANYQDPLYDNKLMHCRVVPGECSISKDNEVAGWNNIKAVFEEV